MRTLAALLLVLLLLPIAQAQREAVAVSSPPGMRPEPNGRHGGEVYPVLRRESVDNDRSPFVDTWFLAGHDNLMNFTIWNNGQQTWNGSFRLNLTGATSPNATISFSVPPRSQQTHLLTVHPEDIGMVKGTVASIDAFYPGGAPMDQEFSGPALVVPSVRFIDPPVRGAEGENDEFETFNMYGGSRSPYGAYLRVAPGVTVQPRLEVRNDLFVTTPAFRITLEGGRTIGPVDVRALEPGQSVTVEMPEFEPSPEMQGGGRFFGPLSQIELRAIGEFTIGGATRNAHLAAYRVERGTMVDAVPVFAQIDVQDGLGIDLIVPRAPQLGVPTRVRVNLSNEARTEVQGTLVVTIMTPGGLYYEVQGPEARSIHVDLAPGERVTDTIEFTPRVTGQWNINTVFRSGEGFGLGGGGGGFQVPGPLRVSFDRSGEVEYARIGERVLVDVSIETERTLQDAQLRVTAGVGYGRHNDQPTGGAYRPGLSQRLLSVETSTGSLGTLRPGGAVNASIEVAGRSSGRYEIVAYVLSEGFAYTSRPFDPTRDSPDTFRFGGYSTGLMLAVQPRTLPPPLALAPLTLGLALFVGMWTFRTRFVR